MTKYTIQPSQGNTHLFRRIRWLAQRYHLTLPVAALIAERAFSVAEVR